MTTVLCFQPLAESVPYAEALANRRVLLSSTESREGLAQQVWLQEHHGLITSRDGQSCGRFRVGGTRRSTDGAGSQFSICTM